jgi:hypothetical protein
MLLQHFDVEGAAAGLRKGDSIHGMCVPERGKLSSSCL